MFFETCEVQFELIDRDINGLGDVTFLKVGIVPDIDDDRIVMVY